MAQTYPALKGRINSIGLVMEPKINWKNYNLHPYHQKTLR